MKSKRSLKHRSLLIGIGLLVGLLLLTAERAADNIAGIVAYLVGGLFATAIINLLVGLLVGLIAHVRGATVTQRPFYVTVGSLLGILIGGAAGLGIPASTGRTLTIGVGMGAVVGALTILQLAAEAESGRG